MKSEEKNLALLPSGFVDLLPPDAEREYAAIGEMMRIFAAFGYQRVKPPLLEFEDSLFAPGPGAAMADETFRVMDPVSHRMMGARSDITPQIARIASSRLGNEPRPLRLCYANDVLRTKAGQQRVERQFTQVGCELIGEKHTEADVESCAVALIALQETGVKNITIDLAYPKIIGLILDECAAKDEERKKIKSALEKRSADGLKSVNKKPAAVLMKLMQASGPAEKTLKELSGIVEAGIFRELKTIHAGVRRAIDELNLDVKITIDPVETRGFKYYSGFGFTVFAKGVSGALGRGGRYDIHFGDKKPVESATGFTLYMDSVRKAMPPAKRKDVVRVDAKTNWGDIRRRQRKGVVVVRGKK